MKRRKSLVRILALFLALLMLLGVVALAIISFEGLAEAGAPARARYDMALSLDDRRMTLDVSLRVTYPNPADFELDEVRFVVSAAAYRRFDTLPCEDAAVPSAFPSGYAPGGALFFSVTVDGEPADWGVSGAGERILRVGCRIPRGGAATFGFDYALILCDDRGGLGYGPLGIRLIDFYPVAAPLDPARELFMGGGFSAIGDFEASEAADYEVVLYAPETYRVAASGGGEGEPVGSGMSRWSFSVENARGFAAVLCRRYREYSAVSDRGVRVRAYTNDRGWGPAAAEAAARALDAYSEWFGEYPYDSLELARAEAVGGAASRAGLLILGEAPPASGGWDPPRLEVYALVASQWFGGLVGCDRAEEPWLADALSAYAALSLVRREEGEAAFFRALNARTLDSLRITLPRELLPNSPVRFFHTRAEYEIAVIDRGVAALYLLEEAMGEGALRSALGLYAEGHRFGIAGTVDFKAALREASGRDWGEYLDYLFATVGGEEYDDFEGFYD